MSIPPESRRRRVAPAFLTGVVGVGALLRLINVNAELWFDEIVTVVNFTGVPLSQVVGTYGLANNHVLNSALVNILARVAIDPWILRLPAVVFGVAGVWAFWFVAVRIWPRPAAAVGTALFTVSYHHIHYTQNARGYSAFVFFALLATGCLVRLLDSPTPRWRDALGYALATGVGLYSMLLMAFVAMGHAVVLVVLRRWRIAGILAAGLALAALLYAPMAGSLLEYYRTRPGETGYRLLSWAFARAIAPIALALAAGGALMLPVVIRLARRQPAVAALILAPAVATVLLPLMRGQGVYPRTFLYLLCAGYLLLVEAIAWAREKRPVVAWTSAAVIAVASLIPLVRFYQLPKQGFRQALAYVDERAADRDLRLGLTLGGKAARFYDSRFVVVEDAAQLRAITGSGSPAWIVTTFHGALRSSAPALHEWLRAEATPRAAFEGVIGDGTVYVHYWPGARPR